MWKKISTAISILCIAVYAGVIVLAVNNIINAAAEHRVISEHEFSGLQDMIRGAGVLGLSGTDLEKEIRAAVLRSLSLDAVIVTVPGGASFAVEKPGERVIIENLARTSYSFDTKWKFVRPPYSAQVGAGSQTTLNIDALADYIDKGRLVDILRETLLMVLLSVMVAFLVLMLDILVFAKAGGAAHAGKPQVPKPPLPFDTPDFEEDGAESAEEDDEERVDEDAERGEDGEERAEKVDKEREPSGNYLGLIQKLHKELAAGDADFVLLCTEWAGNFSSDAPVTAKQIAEAAAAFFKIERISAFKKGDDGVFILLPGMNFKNGLKAARAFHGRIVDNTAFKPAIHDFYAGLTSRAGRQVDPDRLILEAEKAVEKAKEDPGQPIVAFKADPVKYKNYLKKGV
jgi:hypothetical protein